MPAQQLYGFPSLVFNHHTIRPEILRAFRRGSRLKVSWFNAHRDSTGGCHVRRSILHKESLEEARAMQPVGTAVESAPVADGFHARSNRIRSSGHYPHAGCDHKADASPQITPHRFPCCCTDLCTGNGHLCSNQVQDDLPAMRTHPVFEHVDTLPGSQRETAVHKGYRELYLC